MDPLITIPVEYVEAIGQVLLTLAMSVFVGFVCVIMFAWGTNTNSLQFRLSFWIGFVACACGYTLWWTNLVAVV